METPVATKKKRKTHKQKKSTNHKGREKIIGELVAAMLNLAQVGFYFGPTVGADKMNYGFNADYALHLYKAAARHYDDFGAEETLRWTESLKRELELRRMAPRLANVGLRMAEVFE